MTESMSQHLARELDELRTAGLYKSERIIESKQGGTVTLDSGRSIINLCANNYLGLSDHPALIEAGREALSRYGCLLYTSTLPTICSV